MEYTTEENQELIDNIKGPGIIQLYYKAMAANNPVTWVQPKSNTNFERTYRR